MKRFQSVLCTSLLTLAMSSAALAGDISGRSKPGDISGIAAATLSKPGDISGISSATLGRAGDISGFADQAYDTLLGLLTAVIS
jgi:hypothetical protein